MKSFGGVNKNGLMIRNSKIDTLGLIIDAIWVHLVQKTLLVMHIY